MNLKKIVIGLASLVGACSSQPTASPVQAQETQSQVVWQNVTAHEFIFDDKPDGKKVLNAVKKTLTPAQKVYLRFKFGNLAFVQIETPPDAQTLDANGSSYWLAVSVDEPNPMVKLPNAELFKQFSAAVRPNADAMKLDRRVNTMLLLALGNNHYITKAEDKKLAPQWTESTAGLSLKFHRRVSSGTMAPVLEMCTMTVDDKQDFQLQCTPVTAQAE